MGRVWVTVAGAAAVALIGARLILWLVWQYPAPMGDSVLFASLSHYGCTDGILHTPIFPMDAEGRYTWHGITQPALFAALDIGCSNAGNFLALTLLTAVTFGVCLAITRGVQPAWRRLAFAVAVAGLLIKQGFRPDGLAILLALLAEYGLTRKRAAFMVPLVLLAWTHAIGFVVYACYVALQYGRSWRVVWRPQWLTMVVLGVAMNGLMLLLYPFPLAAHVHALLLQGAKVVHQTWGTLSYAFFTNAFYPGFGVVFALAYALAVWRNRLQWLLLVPIWYFFLRVPALFYNVMPLFAVLLYQSLSAGVPGDAPAVPPRARAFVAAGLLVTAVLAAVGITQGVARDVVSKARFDGSLSRAAALYAQLHVAGYRYCRVPAFFTLFLPYDAFEKSYDPTLKECGEAPPDRRLDLIAASGTGAGPASCRAMQPLRPLGWLGRLFHSDSGYSVFICPKAQ